MISLLVVNYRSAVLAAEAIRTARAATTSELQVVAIDNSCDPREADALRIHADVVIATESNVGYAGAINRGRRVCRGQTIVVSNPDVTFGPNAIDLLAEQLDARTAVTGPALFWDDAHTWMLPPGDSTTGWEKLSEVLATRSDRWRLQRDRRRFQRRLAFWSLTRPAPVRTLSGAVMAIRAEDLDALGGFDERFQLYFEETDFLRRVRERGKRIIYVPGARCRHIYNQSAASLVGNIYAESERKYLEKWNGPFVASILSRLGSSPSPTGRARTFSNPLPGPTTGSPPGQPARMPAFRTDDVIFEASPLPDFGTAAGHFPRSDAMDVPPEVWASLKDPALYFRIVVRGTGEVLASLGRYRT